MATTPASRKAKGRRFQQWVAQKIGELLNLPVGADEQIAVREMGQPGSDVRLVGVAREKFPYMVECKNQESWNVPAWVEQARSHKKKTHEEWLLFIKRNNTPPLVCMDAEHFFKLLDTIESLEERLT